MTTFIIKHLKRDQKGFTLIELLAVIVILGVIAAIAVPMISRIMNGSKADADIATANQIVDAARLAITTELNGDAVNKTVNITGTNAAGGSFTGAASDVVGLIQLGLLEATITLPSTKKPITGGNVIFGASGTLTSVTIVTGAATSETVTYLAAALKK